MADLIGTEKDTAVKALHFIIIEVEGKRLMMDEAEVAKMKALMEKLIGAPCSCLWCSNAQSH